ncbi:solute carrier family 1 member 8a isoform X3 [Stigmatopora argus]
MDELLLPGGEEDAASDRSSCADEDGTADGSRRRPSFCRPPRNVRLALRKFAKRNGLLTLSVVAVLTGCTLGFVLRGTELSTQAKIYFSFPGELLMRMLKMLILPLITSSLMSGLSSMESRACCRMGVLTVTYYLWTTFIAVVVGIALVVIIKPGVGTEMESNRLGGGPVMTSADALLDLIRNMVPSNLIEATFQQYKTDLLPVLKVPSRTAVPNFVYVVPGEGQEGQEGKARTVSLELTPAPEVTYKTRPGSSQQMNVLGIVIFSATMGRSPPPANDTAIVTMANTSVLRVGWRPRPVARQDGRTRRAIGQRLSVHQRVRHEDHQRRRLVLPVRHRLPGGRQDPGHAGPQHPGPQAGLNPFTFIRGLLQALVIALATSSSSATLPITMKCLLENCHVDRQIARFVLPVGATINMDGTALYEAVAAIFIAQVNDYELDFGQLVTISITATAASIGAAGIPQAGLVTMVIVLTSVGLPPDDITLIVAIDWILDRFRTMINVLGDALAAGIIAHLCRKDFPLAGEGKAVPSYGSTSHRRPDQRVDLPMTHVHTHKDGEEAALDRHAHTVYYNICQV